MQTSTGGSCANMRRGTNNGRGPSFTLRGWAPPGKVGFDAVAINNGPATAIPHFHPPGTSFRFHPPGTSFGTPSQHRPATLFRHGGNKDALYFAAPSEYFHAHRP
jgi:hypothetical protein